MNLFDSTETPNLKLKNRLWRSATWESLASPEGFLNDEIYRIYEELAQGGVGTIVTGLTDVSPYDWSLKGNMRLCSDCLIDDYRRLTDLVHRYDCNILPEINMNLYVRSDRRIAPVDIDDMTEADIEDAVAMYGNAALRAAKAGFDGVQLHMAYGWFLNRFVNPRENHRRDCYGGCTQNRMRIVGDIVSYIKEYAPGLHISAKFSFFNDETGNFDTKECTAVCIAAEECGIQSIEILGGHSDRENHAQYEACYLDLAKPLRDLIHIPVILTGNNHNPENMNRILNEGIVEYFGMSRPLIREPDLPARWKAGSKNPARCISCGSCYGTHGKRCVFNNRQVS